MALLRDLVPRALTLLLNAVGAPLLLLFLPPVASVGLLSSSLSGVLSWARQALLPGGRGGWQASLSSRDKVVVITGASSGIGRAMALEYSLRGAAVVLAARREARLHEVAKECRSAGAPVALVKRTDVSREDDCRDLIEHAVRHLGQIDVLVNNAGTAHSGLVESYEHEEEFSPVMRVDFWGNVWPTMHALPHLRSSRGQVFVTASAAAFLTYPRQSLYNAAKAAVVQFYDTLRVEPVGAEVAITVAMPGFIHSELTSSAHASSHIPWFWPMLSTEAAAYHLVDAAERRQRYVFAPLWYLTWLPYRVFVPELMDWTQRVLLLGRAPSPVVHDLLATAVGDEATDKLFSIISALPASKVK